MREHGYRYLYVTSTALLVGAVSTLLAELRRPHETTFQDLSSR
jgi:hypothetical protein